MFPSSLLRLSSVPVPRPVVTEAGCLPDPYSGQLVRGVGICLGVQAQITLQGGVVCVPAPSLSTSGTVDILLNNAVSFLACRMGTTHQPSRVVLKIKGVKVR